MAEIVDSIVSNLELRYQQYVDGYAKVIAVRDRDTRSLLANAVAHKTADAALAGSKAGRGGAGDPDLAAARRVRASKTATDAEKANAKAAADAVRQAARDKAAAEKAAAKAAADAVRAAEREKQAALKATQREQDRAAKAAAVKAEADKIAAASAVAAAEREAAARARLAEVVNRTVARSGPLPQAVGGRIGATVPREATGQRGIPTDLLNGTAPRALAAGDVAAEKEINHLLADQATLQSRVTVAKGAAKRQLQDTIAEMRLEERLRKAGLADEEVALRIQERRASVAAFRAQNERRQSTRTTASLSRAGNAALTGIVGAVGVGVAAEIIQSTVDYAKELRATSVELGVSTKDLQAYQAAAREAGVSNDQLSSALGQLANNLGRAKQGSEEQQKIFAALGVDINKVANTGELLPTLIDRISRIKSEAERAAIETALFGEQGRRLDTLLSGGNARINDMAKALLDTGHALSDPEIQRLSETAKKFAALKAELQAEFAHVVAENAQAIETMATAIARLTSAMVQFLGSKPERGVALLGALLGFRLAGPVGAVIGGAIGYQAGIQIAAPGSSGGVRFNAEGKPVYRDASGKVVPPPTAQPVYMRDASGRQVLQNGGKPLELVEAKDSRVQPGESNPKALRSLFAPKPPQGPKGTSADQLQNEADERERRFNAVMGRFQDEQQRAAAEQTQSEYQRSDIERRQIERDLEREKADLRLRAQEDIRRGADRKITESRLSQAEDAAAAAAAERIAVLALQDTVEGLTRDAAARDRSPRLQAVLLQDAEALARTQKDRRLIAEKQRDVDRKRETNDAQLVIARAEQGDPSVSTVDLNNARDTLRMWIGVEKGPR